ncbi:MAG: ABC transporter permease [Candidatus Eisenbacteria bacterium]|nr:ABC transporter permease [Candidatus Eisenbacteria bacterium]
MNAGRLRTIVWKEFVQMRRDRAALGMMLGIPVVQLLLFGYAIRMDVRNLPAAVWDESRTAQSRELVQKLEATGNFRLKREAHSYREAIGLVDAGSVRAAFVIPPAFGRDLKRGRPTQVQVLVDASDPTASQSAVSAAMLVGQGENLEALERHAGAVAFAGRLPVDLRVRPLYNPALKSSIFIVPGIIGLILSVVNMIVTAMAVVRERERGTLEQLIVTPLTRAEIMIGKIAPYVLVAYTQMTAVLVLGHFVFHVPVQGSVLLIYAVSLVFIVANLGLGLFISTVVKNQAQSMQASYFLVMPMVLLSGFMFPREAMPHVAREIGLLFPLTYFLQVLRGILLKGVGLRELWPQALVLSLYAALSFTFSVRRFQKKLE